MDYETILLENANGVARLTLNRPDRLNSFTVQMHDEVSRALEAIAKSDARVLVLTGAGRGFCAGQDLSDRAVAPGGDGVDLGESLEKRYNPLIRRITTFETPVICAVNGVAAGAGANIALACDIVIAAKGAKFIQSFANIGLIPDSGGTWTLPRLAGQARAMGLALTGEPLTAERAEAWGVIWKCVDDDKLREETDALAAKFAAAPTRGLALTKKLIREGAARTLDAQLDIERDAQRTLGRTSDYKEGVAAFTEKRPPKFRANRAKMKTFKFDAFELDPRDAEQEVEIVISTPKDSRHVTLAKFADDVCGEGGGRRLGVPTAFSKIPTFRKDRTNLKRVANVDVDENCAWPCFVISEEWNWRHFLLDTGDAFISFRWSMSA